MKKTICILYGGKSGEHEVSKQSAAGVVKHIDKDKYEIIAIGIGKDGSWHLQQDLVIEEDPQRGEFLSIINNNNSLSVIPEKGIFYNTKDLGIDVVFPVLHGTFGEDGTMQGFLEIADMPYVGAGVLGSAHSMDKEKVKVHWQARGLPVIDFISLRQNELNGLRDAPGKLASMLKEKNLTYPLFVKPAALGSSVGVKKIEQEDDLLSSLEHAFKFDRKIIIEQGISAQEIECAVVGNDNPRAFPPGEVIPHHSFYSYEAKYLDPQGATLKIPAELPDEIKQKVMRLAVLAYSSAEVSGLARVDLFYEKNSSKLYVNEINTIPGFTRISMFPRLCAEAGLAYGDLIDLLIELAFERARQKKGISYSLKTELKGDNG
jgi:D-alanine-D-alanine ligase